MAKKRSLQDDVTTLKNKVRTSMGESENPEGDDRIRSMRKRLKRGLRKLRIIKQRAEGPKARKTGAQT